MGDGDVSAGRGSGESGAQGGLKLINLVISLVVELNRQRSLLIADLHYSSDLSKKTFSSFYSVFIEVYNLTSTLIPKELSVEISKWIADSSEVGAGNNAVTRKTGIALAEKVINSLGNLGLLQLFEEHVAPPFLFDFDLLAAKDKIAAADAADKLKAEQIANGPVPGPSITPVAAGTVPSVRVRKRKRDRDKVA
jgi:hypothetical protein